MCVFIFLVKVTEWPPIEKIAAHSAYKMFSRYQYLIVGLVFFPPRLYDEMPTHVLVEYKAMGDSML